MKLTQEDIKKFGTEDEKKLLEGKIQTLNHYANMGAEELLRAVANREITPKFAEEILRKILMRNEKAKITKYTDSSYCRY